MRITVISLAVLALLAVPAFAQDLTIVSKVTRDGGAPETATSYLSSDHLRMAQPDSEVIFDLKSGRMSVLDGKKKTYYIVTKQDFEAMAAKINEQMNSPEMKKAQEQMANMPPEMRQKMEAMMGSMFAFDVQKSGGGRTIAGYKCENWTIKMGQISTTEECMTTELKLPMQLWDTYRSYADSLKSIASAMGPMAKGLANMQEQMKKVKGFPLASSTNVNIMGRKSSSTSEVTSIKSGSIPATAWEIPAGFTQVENPMMKAFAPKR